MKENKLGTDKMPKLFISYVLPAIITMVITGIQVMVDGLFVSNFVGTNAMASITIVLPFNSLTIGISMVISIGSMSLIGNSLGKKDISKAKNCFITCLVTTIFIACCFALLGTIFTRQLARFLGADNSLIDFSTRYLFINALFTPIMMSMFIVSFSTRVAGHQIRYLIATISSLAFNLCFNTVFIVILDWGITGASLATGLSYLVSLIIVLPPIISKKTTLNIYGGKFKFNLLIRVLFNGMSEGITSFSTAITTFAFNKALMGIYGADGVASYTAISYVSQFAIFVMFGISDGINPIVSYNFGAKNLPRVNECLKIAKFLINGVGIFFFAFFMVFIEQLVTIFSDGNMQMVEIAVFGGRLYAFSFLLSGYNILMGGYFTALNNGLFSAILATLRGLVFMIGCLTIMPLLLDEIGLWLVMPIVEILALCVALCLNHIVKKDFVKIEKQLK